jgi:hypothetical protein
MGTSGTGSIVSIFPPSMFFPRFSMRSFDRCAVNKKARKISGLFYGQN